MLILFFQTIEHQSPHAKAVNGSATKKMPGASDPLTSHQAIG
jgi:hypothetical protein